MFADEERSPPPFRRRVQERPGPEARAEHSSRYMGDNCAWPSSTLRVRLASVKRTKPHCGCYRINAMYISMRRLPNCAATSPPKQRKLPKASLEVAPTLPRARRSVPIESSSERPDKERKNRGPETKKGGNHRQEFDVAHAHALAMANGLVKPANEEEDKGRPADCSDAAKDEALGACEEEVAVVSDAAGAGEVKAVFGEVHLVFVRAEEDGLDTDEEEADSDSGESEGVQEGSWSASPSPSSQSGGSREWQVRRTQVFLMELRGERRSRCCEHGQGNTLTGPLSLGTKIRCKLNKWIPPGDRR